MLFNYVNISICYKINFRRSSGSGDHPSDHGPQSCTQHDWNECIHTENHGWFTQVRRIKCGRYIYEIIFVLLVSNQMKWSQAHFLMISQFYFFSNYSFGYDFVLLSTSVYLL